MSNVNLAIGGRNFAVACADGEEAHVMALGDMVNQRVARSGGASQSETRMLLYAALMLADELEEVRRDLLAVAEPFPTADVADRVDRIAVRLEAIAQRLEERGTSA